MSEQETAIAVTDRQGVQALTAAEIRAQVNRIQEVMKAVMQNGIHYGKVPGCGDKPTLLKPGAEKILATFQIAVDPQIENETRTADEYTVRIKAVATSASGRNLGSAVGEASSNEEKYKWRKTVCEREFDTTPEDRRRIAFKKYDGKINEVKQVRTNVADISNTVLKMAVKRAEVAVCLQVTAASDCFTQDIEDLPEEVAREVVDQRPEIKPPQSKSSQTAANPPPAQPAEEKRMGNPSQPAELPDEDEPRISDAQSKRFYAIWKSSGRSDEVMRAYIFSKIGSSHTKDIPRRMYDEMCAYAGQANDNP
jgi:hypothetical protein